MTDTLPTRPFAAGRFVARRRPATAVALTAALVVAAGCGSTIPTEEEASLLARDDLNPALVESTTTTERSTDTDPRRIYLVEESETRGPRMSYCTFEVEAQDSPADTARATLEQLVATEPGRTSAPRLGCPASYTNFVPTELEINSVEVEDGGQATIDVSGLSAVQNEAQRQAVAQIVWTLTDLIGIDRVVFYSEGKATSVPVGSRTTEPGDAISRADFPDYVEGRSTTTTAPPPPPPAVEAAPSIGAPPSTLAPLP